MLHVFVPIFQYNFKKLSNYKIMETTGVKWSISWPISTAGVAIQKKEKEIAFKVLKTVLDLSNFDDPKVLISTGTIWLVVIILCYEKSHLGSRLSFLANPLYSKEFKQTSTAKNPC